MKLGDGDFAALVSALAQNPALARKRDVQRAARAFSARRGGIRNGDDCAVIADGAQYTLLAAEGMIPAFVEREPWFAGFCAVMTNVSDIAAMGGRPLAVADVLFASEDEACVSAVLEGLCAGAETFGVPIVGGHTGRSDGATCLAAAIVGKARALITSFDARPGDAVIACVDLRGRYRGQSANFDAATAADPRALREKLALLPELAEAGLVHAGKDISMAGLVGTLLMLLETSGCGAVLDLGAVPAPDDAHADPQRWLQAFPSFGYLLVARASRAADVCARFHDRGVHAEVVAEVRPGSTLDLVYEGRSERYWDLERTPLTGFGYERERIPTMPELHFSVRWPDGSAVRYYSPSTIIRAHLRPGASYTVAEFVAQARTALLIASERVRDKYGYACSSAMDTLRQIEETAEGFANLPDAEPARVEVVDVDGPPLTG